MAEDKEKLIAKIKELAEYASSTENNSTAAILYFLAAAILGGLERDLSHLVRKFMDKEISPVKKFIDDIEGRLKNDLN